MKDGLYYRGQRLNSNNLGQPSLEEGDYLSEDSRDPQEVEQEIEDEKGLAEFDRWQDAQEDAWQS